MTILRLEPATLRPVPLHPPPSKSDALRALVLASLLDRPPPAGLAEPLPGDVVAMREGLAVLAGASPGERVEVDCRDGAAPLRFLLTQAAIRPGLRVDFVGARRLGERPHRPLLESLEDTLGPAGFRWRPGNPWPLTVWGADRAPDPRFTVSGAASSQFASSLLLGAAALQHREARPWEVVLTPPVASAGYLSLTADWVARHGWEVERTPHRLRVVGHRPVASVPAVPGDWSSLGYLLLLAWRSGGTVTGVDVSAAHPDRSILDRLAEAGLEVSLQDGVARVSGRATRGIAGSCAEAPDLAPTLAALAMVLPAPSRLTEPAILQHKESDRLAGIERLVGAAGGRTERRGDRLELFPPVRVPGRLAFDPQADHRLAMAASVMAVLLGVPLDLEGPECVAKSFPGFFDALARLGLGVERRPG